LERYHDYTNAQLPIFLDRQVAYSTVNAENVPTAGTSNTQSISQDVETTSEVLKSSMSYNLD
jgi:hypothetical protein